MQNAPSPSVCKGLRGAQMAVPVGFELQCDPLERKEYGQLPRKINGFGYQVISRIELDLSQM